MSNSEARRDVGKVNFHSLLVSKLSADAPEFLPGRTLSTSSTEELPPESVPPPLSDLAPNQTRTFLSHENNAKLKAEENTSKNSDDFDHSAEEGTKLDAGEGRKETGQDDGWTMATGLNNRRRRPKNDSVNFRQRNEQGNGRLPGEMVTLDSYRRFVVWSTDLEFARRSIGQGRLAVILMRGVPGSGKTTLANSLLGNGVICSADNYFLQEDKTYLFDPTRLEDAHTWCLQRAVQAVSRAVSPVIIDNTNVCLWEMTKYVKLAVRNNYDVFFLEPNTEWKWDAAECARRNKHRVPCETIQQRIQMFEQVTGLRPFVESGILRTNNPKPPLTPNIAVPTTRPNPADVSRSSSSSDVIELKKEDARENRSSADDWGSSDSSSWANDDQSKCDTLPTMPPGLQTSSSTSSLPKEQRMPRTSPQAAVSGAKNSPIAQDAKKLDAPTRRKRPDGYVDLQFGLATGSWQLPNDLVGGLKAAVNKKEDSDMAKGVPVFSAHYREINVRDGYTQVSEKHLTLAALEHRRLSRQSIDGCEFDLDERTIKKTVSHRVIRCDAGVQCELDGSIVTSSEEDSLAKARMTLQSCFPQVNVEDLEEILIGCGGQLEWAVNVLLDSGYNLDWSTKESSAEREVPIELSNETEPIDKKRVQPDTHAASRESNNSRTDANKAVNKNEPAQPSRKSVDVHAAQAMIDGAPAPIEGESPTYTMELSVDMVKQLQRIFTFIFPDIPPDLLGPSQLKLRMPHEMAEDLFRCWLKSQTNNEFSEGDSDFFSDVSFSDELAENHGNSASASGRVASAIYEEDVLAVERQILMDEQFARQLAAEEEDEEEPSHAPKHSSSSMASQIKLKRLYELFPSVDRNILKSLFSTNNCHLDRTIDMLSDTYDIPKRERTGSPGRGYATRAAQKPAVTREEASDPSESELTYHELRQEAHLHFEERQANFKKAQDYYRRGMAEVAYYYAQRGHLHNVKFKEANERAAKKILQQRKAANPAGVLDLHGLHVSEAISALVDVLRECDNRPGKEIKIITGQGLHSTNGPKIKPAVVNYLRQRGYCFMEQTPGVLLVTMK